MNASTVRLQEKLRKLFDIKKHIHAFNFKMLIAGELAPNMSQIYQDIKQASREGESEIYYEFPDCENTVTALSLRSVVAYEAFKRLRQKGYDVSIVRPKDPIHLKNQYYRTLKISWK